MIPKSARILRLSILGLVLISLVLLAVQPVLADPPPSAVIHASMRRKVDVGETARLVVNYHTVGNEPLLFSSVGCDLRSVDGGYFIIMHNPRYHPASLRPDGTMNWQTEWVAGWPGSVVISCHITIVHSMPYYEEVVWAKPITVKIRP